MYVYIYTFFFFWDDEQKEQCFEGKCAERPRYFQRTQELLLQEGLKPEIGKHLGVVVSRVYFSPSWLCVSSPLFCLSCASLVRPILQQTGRRK